MSHQEKPTGKPMNPNSLKNLKRDAGPGRPKLTELERQARDVAKDQIARIWPMILAMNLDELESMRKDQSQPVIVAWFISAAKKGIRSGDLRSLMQMYDRILGKAIHIDDSSRMPQVVYIPEYAKDF